jgi:hypothetical protein
MSRCWRIFRILMAWCAIVAYAAPAAVHGATGHGATAPLDAPQTHACAGHGGKPHHHADGSHGAAAASDETAKASDAAPATAGHKDGSTPCCVAMCVAALPISDCVAPWVQCLSSASDSRIVDRMAPVFVTRLDRPPKVAVAPTG